MATFLNWLNRESETHLVLKSALAHVWFVTIHPFEDRNGRIARAVADMMLPARRSPAAFLQHVGEIQQKRNAYRDVLEKSQKGTLDITRWIEWFLTFPKRSINASGTLLEAALARNRFWKTREPRAAARANLLKLFV